MSFVPAQALGNEFDDLVLSRLNRKRADPNLRDKFAARLVLMYFNSLTS
jgi:hypothetical protein